MDDRAATTLRALLLLGGCVAIAWMVQATTVSGDYQLHSAVMGDNAAPAIAALVRGHLGELAARQPLMGLVSLVWRAPAAGVGIWLGAGDQSVYQLGVAACLAAALGLVAWLAARAESPMQFAAVAVAAAVILAGPVTTRALQMGHPEEVLTTVLAAGAVIAAGRDRRGWAAGLLGLAIGSKPWAVLAAPCVLAALPEAGPGMSARVILAARTAVVAAPAVALLPVADTAAFHRSEHVIGALHGTTPFSLWWLVRAPAVGVPSVPFRPLPLALTRSDAAVAVLSVAFAAIWIYWRRGGRRRGPVNGLALLALMGLLRCLADPAPVTYYFVPVIIPLALWEAGSLRRIPLVAVVTGLALDWFPQAEAAAVAGRSPFGLAGLNLMWLSAGAALVTYLLRAAFDRGERQRGVAPGAVPAR